MSIILFFIFGLIIGSFLNVVVSRGIKNENLGGRSYCDNCGKILAWYELMPILSYFIQRGKCRSCGFKIPLQYFLIELSTALLFVLTYIKFSHSGNFSFIYYLITISFWIVLFIFDCKYYAIPDKIIFSAIGFSLLYTVFLILTNTQNILDIIYSVLISTSLFLVLVVVSKEKWMGWGDVLLGIFLGLFLSDWQYALLALILSFIIGGMFAIILMLLRQKKFGDKLPFGPFLITGALIALFFGNQIISFYFKLIF